MRKRRLRQRCKAETQIDCQHSLSNLFERVKDKVAVQVQDADNEKDWEGEIAKGITFRTQDSYWNKH
jgi:hypothetical protein